jgi:hypothetical protein
VGVLLLLEGQHDKVGWLVLPFALLRGEAFEEGGSGHGPKDE